MYFKQSERTIVFFLFLIFIFIDDRNDLDQLMKDIQTEYDISETNFLTRYLDLHNKVALVTPDNTTPQQFTELNNEIVTLITELNNYKAKIDSIRPLLLDIQNDMYIFINSLFIIILF